ncbi:hypothetical protein ACHWQZ_G004458 [Mnemiopsis leidyi]
MPSEYHLIGMDEKEKAVTYIKDNKIDVILQQTLNDLYKRQPGNVFGYLAEELDKFAVKPSIKIISGYEIKSMHEDVKRVAIEATCLVHNHDEITGSATVGFNSLKDTMDLDELKLSMMLCKAHVSMSKRFWMKN